MGEVDLEFAVDDEIEEIILAHLSECECPYLVGISYDCNEKLGGRVGLNFGSSRELLLCCGWVMAVSHYFGKIADRKLKGIINHPSGGMSAGKKANSNETFGRTLKEVLKSSPTLLSPVEKIQTISHLFRSIDLHRVRCGDLKRKIAQLNKTFLSHSSKKKAGNPV